MKNADMPAMPIVDPDAGYPLDVSRYGNGLSSGGFASGITKREMMAMHMMAGIIVGCDSPNTEWCASIAVDATEKLIAELERTCHKT